MNRQQKEVLVHELHETFGRSEASFVVRCQGMTVAEMHELRLKLAPKEGKLKVAKNRLTKIALAKTASCVDMNSSMKGQTAVVFVKSDFTGVAKVLHDFAKKHESLQIVAGCCESQLFDKAGVSRLATIPSREVLLAQVCAMLQAPIAQFVRLVDQVKQQRSQVTEQQEQ